MNKNQFQILLCRPLNSKPHIPLFELGEKSVGTRIFFIMKIFMINQIQKGYLEIRHDFYGFDDFYHTERLRQNHHHHDVELLVIVIAFRRRQFRLFNDLIQLTFVKPYAPHISDNNQFQSPVGLPLLTFLHNLDISYFLVLLLIKNLLYRDSHRPLQQFQCFILTCIYKER